MEDLLKLSISEISEKLDKKEVSVLNLIKLALLEVK